MNDSDRLRYEMQVRSAQFGVDNAADFTGITTTTFADLKSLVDDSESKAAARENICKGLRPMTTN